MRRPSVKSPKVDIQRLAHSAGLDLPSYQTGDAAGLDLAAAVPENAAVTLAPGERALIPTGLSMSLPPGYEAQIRPRSGLALKHGITVLNSPGTIDADYRGEIQVLLINLGAVPFAIGRGDRIAQMIIAPVTRVILVETKILPVSERGSGGFGSTGVFRKALQKNDLAKREERKKLSSKALQTKHPHHKSKKTRD